MISSLSSKNDGKDFFIIKQEVENMRQQLEAIMAKAKEQLAAVENQAALEELRLQFLGKKGELTAILKGMGGLTPEERPVIGQLANEVRSYIESAIETKKTELAAKALEEKLKAEKIDVTMPAKKINMGSAHPLSNVIEEITQIFIGMGYEVAEGPEVELDYYNFEALNTPKNHPARDAQDTFYFTENILLRSQTSPVQARVMQSQKPPIKIICPGKVYRADEIDATHSPVFHQIEGLVIDKGITMGDLKGTLELFAKNIFGENTKIRLRPHHFPFTEPSCEVDVSCWNCGGVGCRTCKGEGWIEILGAGMVHPNVLRECGIDPEEYSGFAFGLGVERTTMGRFGIKDLRLFFENDLRFLKQF